MKHLVLLETNKEIVTLSYQYKRIVDIYSNQEDSIYENSYLCLHWDYFVTGSHLRFIAVADTSYVGKSFSLTPVELCSAYDLHVIDWDL